MAVRRGTTFVVCLLLMLLAWGQARASVASEPKAASLQSTRCEVPQWTDLGLDHLLVVASQPTVSAPPSLRLLHDTASAVARGVAVEHRHGPVHPLPSASPHRPQPHYLYLLLCLRL